MKLPRAAQLLVAVLSAIALLPTTWGTATSGETYGNRCVQLYLEGLADASSKSAIQVPEAEALLERIASKVGALSDVTVIQCDRAEKAFAFLANGELSGVPAGRYLIFNKDWMREVIGPDEIRAIALFGHELGHFINGHFSPTSQVALEQEEQADQFAGCAVARLGGDWETVEDLFLRLRAEVDSTYPGRLRSLTAVNRGFVGCSDAPPADVASLSFTGANPAALQFLGALDGGRLSAAWALVDEGAKGLIVGSMEDFATIYRGSRARLGVVSSRSQVGLNSVISPVGFPSGAYRVINFLSKFEGDTNCRLEVVVLRSVEEGTWRLFNYNIDHSTVPCL